MRPRRPALLSFLFSLTALLAAAPGVRAQWSDDPTANLVLADRTGEQVQPKIVATDDGGVYVSWYDNSSGGYDVVLQRLDAAGHEQWPHDGILVADRGFSSTQDYGLGLDTAGNALLTFRDDRGMGVQITAAKVTPGGLLAWGADGVQLTATTDFVAAPKIAGTSDGNVVVAWTQDVNVEAQKLDPNGAPLWGAGVALAAASGSFALSDLQPAGAGTAVVSWIAAAGGAGPRHLWAQKLASADGASLWGASHLQVYDAAGGSLQFGAFPSFVSDGSGGAVFGWYTSSPTLQVRVQRVLANGSEAFAHDGVEASTDATRLRVSPSVAWNPANGEIFVFWTELNSLQSQFGVTGQKLDPAGARQWGTGGRTLVPLGATEITQVRALPWGDGAAVVWAETVAFGNQPIRAARVDSAGDFVWSPSVRDLATSPTATSRLDAAASTRGFAVYAWSDGATGSADIRAQNLLPDGSLGPGLIFADGFESGDTSAWSASVP